MSENTETVIEILSTTEGDKKLYFDDVNPEEREKMAEKVLALMKDGNALFLIKGKQSLLLKDMIRIQMSG